MRNGVLRWVRVFPSASLLARALHCSPGMTRTLLLAVSLLSSSLAFAGAQVSKEKLTTTRGTSSAVLGTTGTGTDSDSTAAPTTEAPKAEKKASARTTAPSRGK